MVTIEAKVITYKLDPQDVGRVVRWIFESLKTCDIERNEKLRLADYFYNTAMIKGGRR